MDRAAKRLLAHRPASAHSAFRIPHSAFAMSFAHPYFLLLLLLPVLAWWRGRRGQQAAFLYSSVDLLKGVSDIHRSSAGRLEGTPASCVAP